MHTKSDSSCFQKSLLSFKYAFRGLFLMMKGQTNARIHFVAMLIVLAAAIYFPIKQAEWLAVIISIGMVFAAEALNSSIEEMVDLLSPEYKPRAGKVKDIAAGAVLISALAALAVGFVVFLPYIIKLL